MRILQIHLLGDFHLAYDGQAVLGVITARLQALLCYLVLHRHALPEPEHFLWVDTQTVQWRPDASFILDVADFEATLTYWLAGAASPATTNPSRRCSTTARSQPRPGIVFTSTKPSSR